ncbi:MAG: PAS domain S-box protein [Desulfobacula sp.]|nr:PAS domain S-box protein [Desulfobacula sp.]
MMSIKQKSIFNTYPLLTRVGIYIIGFGIIIAFITSLLHLWLSYSLEIDRIHAKLDHLEKEQIALLTNSLWSYDKKSINIQLKSILSDTDIIYIEIKKAGVIKYSAGDQTLKEKDLERNYTLVHRNKILGHVSFFATTKNAKKHLIVTAVGSLIAQLAGIFLICFFIVGVLSIILTKPISQILHFTNTIELNNLNSNFSLNRSNKKPDEFDAIAFTLDNMRQRLKDDIEEIKLIKNELMLEQTFTQKALNAQQDTFFLFEPATGKAIRWNRAFSETTGYSDDEIATMKAPEAFYSINDLEKAETFIKNVIKIGFGTIELNLICKNQHKIPTEYNVSVINDNNDIPKYLISIGRNLTERKQLELRFQQLAENSTDWIWEFDENNIFTYSSSGVAKLLGYTPEEVIGKSAFDLIPTSEKEKVSKEFSKSKNYHEPFTNLQNINQHKDGHLVTIESSGSPIFNSNGEFKGYRGIDRDISIRKRMENELRQIHKMESIGTLAGGIAHDFNNILFPILGHTEMLLKDIPEGSSAHNALKKIYSGGIRARDLVSQILTFSRQDSSEIMPIKIQPIVKETLKLIRSVIPTTIKINQYIEKNCRKVKADPTQIHQIIMNLTTNASHAMKASGGELTVSLKETQLGEHDVVTPDMLPGIYVCLSVADTGEGIDKFVIDKIFDPFFTTKEKGKGTGMGLSVVHGIVKSVGGVIQVYSEPGKETEFRVYLPVVENFSNKQSTISKTEIQDGTEHILLVDDEKNIIEMEKEMLELMGYQVTSHTSSIEALEAFRLDYDKFDLVITDMAMPNMSGDILSRELIKIHPDIPILLCTGFSEIMSEKDAASLGIKGFLLKPIEMKDLSYKIREVLDKK